MVRQSIQPLAGDLPALCVYDTQGAILTKLKDKAGDLDAAIQSWEKLKADTRLLVLPDPDAAMEKHWKRELPLCQNHEDQVWFMDILPAYQSPGFRLFHSQLGSG